MDRDTSLRKFLQTVAQAGIVIGLNGDKLNVAGPNNPELIAGIKQQKAGIVELIKNIPYETIEEHYGARLKKGNQLLEEALEGIEKNPDDVKLKFLLFYCRPHFLNIRRFLIHLDHRNLCIQHQMLYKNCF